MNTADTPARLTLVCLSPPDDASWRDAPPGLGYWETWGVAELADYDGIVLYRTRVRLTPDQARRSAVLTIGPVDEIDVTWVNGRGVGSSSGGDRSYRVAPGVSKRLPGAARRPDGGLAPPLRPRSRPTAFELCGPAAGSCRYADATRRGDTVSLDTSERPNATRVRYCWADAPVHARGRPGFAGAALPAGKIR
jgi:hypothetical protein